ncbi:uncharacterized protein BDV17DRAFT_274203 [Aspergillus undulatus]|uniref:uncharacterized protein n=1 Tax=Aspergillus undulatus TaxID=1810928 RepID=UPI003CCDBD27
MSSASLTLASKTPTPNPPVPVTQNTASPLRLPLRLLPTVIQSARQTQIAAKVENASQGCASHLTSVALLAVLCSLRTTSSRPVLPRGSFATAMRSALSQARREGSAIMAFVWLTLLVKAAFAMSSNPGVLSSFAIVMSNARSPTRLVIATMVSVLLNLPRPHSSRSKPDGFGVSLFPGTRPCPEPRLGLGASCLRLNQLECGFRWLDP